METIAFTKTAETRRHIDSVPALIQITARRPDRRQRVGKIVAEIEKEDLAACLAKVGSCRDVEAFEILFKHFGPKVRAFMLKRGSNRQSAEELMQETMMMIWNKASLFDPSKGSVSSWIFTIARNVRIDAFRKANRPEFDPNDPAFVPEDVAPADEIYGAEQDAERLRKAIVKLPPDQAELLKLSFYEEISHGMIAQRLNIPLGTVKSRIRLAFSRLRDMLGDAA